MGGWTKDEINAVWNHIERAPEGEHITMTKTFHDYLTAAEASGVIDFRLRIMRDPEGRLDFYIHPDGKDGETGDFNVVGNVVMPMPGGVAAGSAR